MPEVALIDTPEFQRLRGIKQLGTAYLVYPSALHTRFEHSLGTSWLAARMIDSIEARGMRFDEIERLQILVAALLHDVSHIPFGHTLEDERRILDRHDRPERMQRALSKGVLGQRLAQQGLREPILEILQERGDKPYLHEIISGAIGADLLDYLARDAYFCGLSCRYDHRIFRQFIIEDGHLVIDAQKNGTLREDVISEVINLLRLRYFLSERVYFHHSKTASGAMLSRAVEFALAEGLMPDRLHDLKDEGLLTRLRSEFPDCKPLIQLLDCFESRDLYKRVYLLTSAVGEKRQQELVASYHRDRAERERAERHLEKKLKLKPGELIIYCPAAGMALKEADVLVKIDRGAAHLLSSLDIPEIEALLQKHRDLWKFYVFIASRHKGRYPLIAQTCEEYFRAENHLPALESGQLYLKF